MQTIIFIVFCFFLFYLPLDHGGHTVRSQSVFLVFTFLCAALYVLFREKINRESKINFNGLALIIGAFLLTVLPALFISGNFYGGLIQFFLFLGYFLVFIIVSNMFQDAYKDKFFVFLAFSVITVDLLGLYFYQITNLTGFPSDLYSTFYQKNICAGFLILNIPVFMSLFLTEKNKSKVILFGLASYLSLLALFFTQSRGGLIIFIACFMWIIISLYKFSPDKKKFLLKIFILLFVFLISIRVFAVKTDYRENIAQPFLSRNIESVADMRDSSKLARLEFYRIAFQMFKDHAVTGVGLGNFALYYPLYAKDPRFYSKFTHNFYLQILCETGIFGFILFLIILFLILKEYFKALKLAAGTKYFPVILGLAAGGASALAHILLDVDWLFAAPPYYFFFFSGIIFYYANYLRQKREAPRTGTDLICNARYFFIAFLILAALACMTVYFADCKAQMAEYYRKEGNFKAALNEYKSALRLNPVNPEYYREAASLYFYKTGNGEQPLISAISLGEAVFYAKHAVKLEKLKPNNYALLARLYREQGNENLYAANLLEALKKDPINYPSTYNDLAAYYIEKGDIRNAKEIVNKVLSCYKDEYFTVMLSFRKSALKGQISDTYVMAAAIEKIAGNDGLAEKYLLKALKLNENNISANYALARLRGAK